MAGQYEGVPEFVPLKDFFQGDRLPVVDRPDSLAVELASVVPETVRRIVATRDYPTVPAADIGIELYFAHYVGVDIARVAEVRDERSIAERTIRRLAVYPVADYMLREAQRVGEDRLVFRALGLLGNHMPSLSEHLRNTIVPQVIKQYPLGLGYDAVVDGAALSYMFHSRAKRAERSYLSLAARSVARWERRTQPRRAV